MVSLHNPTDPHWLFGQDSQHVEICVRATSRHFRNAGGVLMEIGVPNDCVGHLVAGRPQNLSPTVASLRPSVVRNNVGLLHAVRICSNSSHCPHLHLVPGARQPCRLQVCRHGQRDHTILAGRCSALQDGTGS